MMKTTAKGSHLTSAMAGEERGWRTCGPKDETQWKEKVWVALGVLSWKKKERRVGNADVVLYLYRYLMRTDFSRGGGGVPRSRVLSGETKPARKPYIQWPQGLQEWVGANFCWYWDIF